MSLGSTARSLTKAAFELVRREELTVDAVYRRMKGATNAGDDLRLDPEPTLHAVYLIDDSPAHAAERNTQGDMRTTEERPEKRFMLDWAQCQAMGFVPSENDELDVTEEAGVVRYRIDQITSDPVKAYYNLSSRRTGA